MILATKYHILSICVLFQFFPLFCMEPNNNSLKNLIDNEKNNRAYAKALSSAIKQADMQSLKIILLKIVDFETAIPGIDFLIEHTEDEHEILHYLISICNHEKTEVFCQGIKCAITYQKPALFNLIIKHLNDSGDIYQLEQYINDAVKSPLIYAVKMYLHGNTAVFEIIKYFVHLNITNDRILSQILFSAVSANDTRLFNLIFEIINIDTARGRDNRNILYEAVINYKIHGVAIIPLIRRIIAYSSSLLDIGNNSGLTPRDAISYMIIKSLESGDQVAFTFFAQYIPLCKLKNKNGDTILHLAINTRALHHDKPDFVNLIIEKNPKLLDVENKDNISPRQLLENTKRIS